MTRLIFFAHDALDAAVQRRIGSLSAIGVDVLGLTMRRGPAIETSWENIDLGRTRDAAFLQRIAVLFRALPTLFGQRFRLADADIFYARNLDMLVLARLAGLIAGSPRKLVYECLDVHRFLARDGVLGSLMRGIERSLLRGTDLVVVSSPAFLREYFQKRHPGRYRALLVENKLPEGYDYGDRPSAGSGVADKVIRIGWFGNLRCRRSLALLLKTAGAFPNRVSIVLRGVPAISEIPDFYQQIAGRANVQFAGRYNWPQDLASLYGTVDLAWAGDFHDPNANSLWLLPNRLYEGGYYGVPPLAPAQCETGRWIEANGFGFTLPEPLEESLPHFLGTVDVATIRQARDRLLSAPKDVFVQPRETLQELLDTLLGTRQADVSRMPVSG